MTRYSEEQSLRTPWIWILVLTFAAAAWVVFGGQIFLGHRIGQDPPPTWMAVVLLLIFGVGFPALAMSFRLTIEVDEGELRWALRPFLSRRVRLSEIETVEPCTYRPILDYFGWGIRYHPRSGWAYTIDGNRGVRLQLTSGKRLLLGSRNPEMLADQIERARARAAAREQTPPTPL